MTLVPRILDGLKENGAEDVLVLVGGTIRARTPRSCCGSAWPRSSRRARTPARSSTSSREGHGLSVDLSREGGVAVLTVNRPDALNAFDVETLTALRDHLRELAEDSEARVVVVTGAGERAFAAGADIKYMSGLDVDGAKEWGNLGHEVGHLLETMPKPTIAAINGFALGGGCEVALACDFRYASSNAKLGQPEVNLGIIPGWGGTQRLARAVGIGLAKGSS